VGCNNVGIAIGARMIHRKIPAYSPDFLLAVHFIEISREIGDKSQRSYSRNGSTLFRFTCVSSAL
jgi:hypothetical protein